MGIFKKWLNVNQLNENANINQLNHRLRTLFYCACVRQIWNKLTDQRSKDAIIISELYVDGKATYEELLTARTAADVAAYAAYWTANAVSAAVDNRKEMIITQGKLLESIIQPNLQYNKEWSTSTVKLLTQQIYEQQDWNLLPILADALQDNNCNNDELLLELRNGNLWCKGNKLLDEILEKRS